MLDNLRTDRNDDTPRPTNLAADIDTANDAINKLQATVRNAVFNVGSYGAVGDGKTLTDVSILAGSTTLTSSSGPFTAADKNKVIAIANAGASGSTAGGNHIATILSVLSSTQVTLDVAAVRTATGGSLTPATYSYRISAINLFGETLASTAATIVLGANQTAVRITWPATPGAQGYKIYGRTGGSELLLATITDANTLSWLDTGANTPAGALPGSNTTALPPVPAPTLVASTTGGTLPAGTYNYRLVGKTLFGGVVLPSPEAAVSVTTTGTTSKVTISWRQSGVAAWDIYGRTPGGEQKLASVGNVTSYVDDGSLTPSGALPVADTTAMATPAAPTLSSAAAGTADYGTDNYTPILNAVSDIRAAGRGKLKFGVGLFLLNATTPGSDPIAALRANPVAAGQGGHIVLTGTRNILVEGGGIGVTDIRFLASTGFVAADVTNIGFKDLTASTGPLGSTGIDADPFKILGCTRLTFLNVNATRGGYGFQVKGCIDVKMANCTARDMSTSRTAGGTGFTINDQTIEYYMGQRDILITNCHASGCVNGFEINGINDPNVTNEQIASVLLENCSSHDNTGNGFQVTSGMRSALNNCTSKSNGANGFWSFLSDYVRFTGCYAEGNVNNGFHIQGSSYNAIDACVALANLNGIFFATDPTSGATCTRPIISASIARLNTQYGLNANTSSVSGLAHDRSCEFSGNVVGDIAASIITQSDLQVDVAPFGGDFTTLSAALAAITDASSSKEYTIFVRGSIVESATVNGKSNVNVIGVGRPTINVASTANVYGFVLSSVVNSRWQNLHLIRSGAVVSSVFATLQLTGSTDNTVRIDSCLIENLCTGSTNTRGLQLNATGGPIVSNCRIVAGGTSASGVNYASGNTTLINCDIYGAGTGQGLSVSQLAGLIANCNIYGGNGGTGGMGMQMAQWNGGEIRSCLFMGGSTGACHGVTLLDNCFTLFDDCTFIQGPGGAGAAALNVFGSSAPRLFHCTAKPPEVNALVSYTSANNGQFQPTSAYSYQVAAMGVNVVVAQAGQTLNIGTTIGGSDIASGIDISTTGSKAVTLGAGALKIIASGGFLYATPSGAAADASFQIYISAVVCAGTSNYAMNLTSTGPARIDGCELISAPDCDAVLVSAVAVTANAARFTNNYIEARPKDTASKKAVNAASAWNPAPFYRNTLVGGTTNITAAAGTANGTNTEI